VTAPQSALTIVAEIAPNETDDLRQLLEAMNEDAPANDVLPFGQLPGTHYARLLILDEATDSTGAMLPAALLFTSDFDGSAFRYLRRLVHSMGPGLDRIYSHCKDYPHARAISPEARLAYLRAHRTGADALYVNTIGRTVTQIRQEARLRDAIESFLDARTNSWTGRAPLDVRAEIQQFVRDEGTLDWALSPPRPLSPLYRLSNAVHLLVLPLILCILLPVLVVTLPIWVVLIRIREASDAAPHIKPDPAHVAQLAAAEDVTPQNQFSAVGLFKPGRLRGLTARAVLLLVNYGIRHFFDRGNLAGVKTIHFARWVPLNGRRRMIFASNYDGSLESYMDDFIDKLAWGLNAVFSNGIGYPKTRWLLFGGAKDEQAFKDYLRVHQIRTDVWYAAYAGLTAVNIDNNAQIRAGLSGEMSPAEAETWLSRL
jgi:hypothetical protein